MRLSTVYMLPRPGSLRDTQNIHRRFDKDNDKKRVLLKTVNGEWECELKMVNEYPASRGFLASLLAYAKSIQRKIQETRTTSCIQ